MKKLSFLLLFIFSIAGFLVGSVYNVALADISKKELSASAVEGNTVEIGSFEDLQAYVNAYAKLKDATSSETYSVSGQDDKTASANDNIVLTADITFPENQVLMATIGTKAVPFNGTFDGKGYRITNFALDLSQNSAQYIGLFGMVEGKVEGAELKKAAIKNLAFSGDVSIKVGSVAFAYIGAVAGYVNNADVENIQISTENINFDFQSTYSINLGVLIGETNNTTLNHIIARNSNEIDWKVSGASDKTYNFGGLVGKTDNTRISQVIVSEKLKNTVSASDAFLGTLYVGGLVGNILGGPIVNIAIENQYQFTNAIVGEVAAVITSTDVSYIRYKSNSLPIFASNPNFNYRDNYVVRAEFDLADGREYFKVDWSRNNEYWNFDTVWHIESDNTIYLQNFYPSFSASVTIPKLSEATILKQLDGEGEEVLVSGKYGTSNSISFAFADSDESNTLKNYFGSIVIEHGRDNEVARITLNDKAKASVSITDNDLYDILESDDHFDFVIKSLNFASEGDYTITPVAKTFRVNVVSRLVSVEDNVPTEDPSKLRPGYVSYNTTPRVEFPLDMDYGDVYTLTTTPMHADTPYASYGWWFDYSSSKKDEYFEISVNGVTTKPRSSMVVVFGGFINNERIDNYKLITEACDIYADYTEDACEVLFSLGDGIARIGCGGQTVEQSIEVAGQGLKMPRQNNDLRLDIYVKEGYNFMVEEFVEFMNIYKGTNSLIAGDFCKEVEDGYTYLIDEGLYKYQFSLDMTKTDDNWKNSFTVNTRDFIEPIKTLNLTWLWIVLGVIGGALLIGGIVLLIVFLVRRRGGGYSGGSGKVSKPKKSDYKNAAMY